MKFIIGLLFGMLLAGGAVYYLDKSPTPFEDKGIMSKYDASGILQQSKEPNPIILAPSTKLQQLTNENNTSSGAPKSSDKPIESNQEYDFYDVLQGNKSIKAPINEPPKNINYDYGYLIQIGAFASQDLANNMKAQLALMGYVSTIKSQQINGQMLHKVVIGPFDDKSQANELLDELKNQDIPGEIINNNK